MTTSLAQQQEERDTVPARVIGLLSIVGGLAYTALSIVSFTGIVAPQAEYLTLFKVATGAGIILGPLFIAGGIGALQRQMWGRSVLMAVGYVVMLTSACRTSSFINPQAEAAITMKLGVLALFVLTLWGVNWLTQHRDVFE